MSFEAIAAIELANQAINGIKELAGHVTSVGQMGKQLTQLADAHEELERDAEKGNMEAFWALEDIKKKAIKDGLIYIAVVLAGCLTVAGGVWLLLAIISLKGR